MFFFAGFFRNRDLRPYRVLVESKDRVHRNTHTSRDRASRPGRGCDCSFAFARLDYVQRRHFTEGHIFVMFWEHHYRKRRVRQEQSEENRGEAPWSGTYIFCRFCFPDPIRTSIYTQAHTDGRTRVIGLFEMLHANLVESTLLELCFVHIDVAIAI